MQLEDLYKLAGIQQSNTPAIEPQPVEQPVAEQPMDGREDMKAMIALITPQQLNQLVGDAPVEEEGFANSGDEHAGEPEEYKGPLGSPADLSLRRYLDANGQPVHVEENVYTDHKVEDITEAWNEYKTDPVAEVKKELEEEPNEGNEFSGALAQAKKDGKKEFKVGGKTYKVESEETSRLKKLAGAQQVDEAPGDQYTGNWDPRTDPTFVGHKYLRNPAQWKKDTPSQLQLVIKKYHLDPSDAEQLADEEMNADIDAIADLHDDFIDRTGSDSDIDSGEEFLASPEYAKVMTMVGDLCSAMGMEGAGREECGNGLMKHVDENTPQESAEISDLRTLEGI